MSKYQIISELGTGFFGTTYKIKYLPNNKFYALKRQKIMPKQKSKTLKSKIWREIYFASKMKSYPNHFMQLYNYEIIDNCDHIQVYPKKYAKPNAKMQKRLDILAKSKICIELIYDLKDGILDDIHFQLSQSQLISMQIQILYALYLTHSNGYYHLDVKSDNIGFIRTSLEYINILNYKIPTYGYIWSLIDYGNVLSFKFNLKNSEKKFMSNPQTKLFDFFGLYCMLYTNSPHQFIRQLKLISKSKEFVSNIKKTPKYKFCLEHFVINNEKISFLQANMIYLLLFPDQYLKLLNLDPLDNKTKLLIEMRLNIGDCLYMILNLSKPKILINYLYLKLV
jgi:serine/threonine protein kinase